jgi:aryl carrier-like protein
MNNKQPSSNGDLTDPPKDQEKLKPESTEIDIPEVKDIPGQENISPIPLKGLSDITPSSDDEEGAGVVDKLNTIDDDEDLIVTGTETDISPDEVAMLERMDGFEATADNQNLVDASLDSVDADGTELNVDSFGEELSGKDLDVAAFEQDDDMEEIGEEDEENNLFSTDTEDENESQ